MTKIRYRVKQHEERWSKNKIFLFIIFVWRRSIFRYYFGGWVSQEIFDEIKNFKCIGVRIKRSIEGDVFDTMTRDNCQETKSSTGTRSVGTQLAIGE